MTPGFECNWHVFFPHLFNLKQSVDMNMLSPIVNVTGHALDKDSSTFDSNIIIKKEEKELHGTSESSGSSKLLLELHEKRSDNPEKIEAEKALLYVFNLNSLIFYSCMS